jgi:hypothetical protein
MLMASSPFLMVAHTVMAHKVLTPHILMAHIRTAPHILPVPQLLLAAHTRMGSHAGAVSSSATTT